VEVNASVSLKSPADISQSTDVVMLKPSTGGGTGGLANTSSEKSVRARDTEKNKPSFKGIPYPPHAHGNTGADGKGLLRTKA
jgi:hypothetical protein